MYVDIYVTDNIFTYYIVKNQLYIILDNLHDVHSAPSAIFSGKGTT